MDTLRKETKVGVTCWKLKSCLFKALVLPTFTNGTKILGGDSKNSHWKVFKKYMKMHMIFQVKMCSLTTYHIMLTRFGEQPMELYALKLTMGFQQWLAHLSPSWLVNKATSFFWHQAKQKFNIFHKPTTMWKTSWGISLGNLGQPNCIKNNIWWYQRVFFLLKSGTLSIS